MLTPQDKFALHAGCKADQVRVTIVNFDKFMDPVEALAELDKRGLRPATFAELLALAAVQPDLQRSFEIAVFGSGWKVNKMGDFTEVYILSGKKWNATSKEFEPGRSLCVGSCGGVYAHEWFAYARILAARKTRK